MFELLLEHLIKHNSAGVMEKKNKIIGKIKIKEISNLELGLPSVNDRSIRCFLLGNSEKTSN